MKLSVASWREMQMSRKLLARPWLATDDEQLRELVARKLGRREIATKLHRTRASVSNRMVALGLVTGLGPRQRIRCASEHHAGAHGSAMDSVMSDENLWYPLDVAPSGQPVLLECIDEYGRFVLPFPCVRMES